MTARQAVLVTLALNAPKGPFGRGLLDYAMSDDFRKAEVHDALYRLRSEGLVEFPHDDSGKRGIRVTEAGLAQAAQWQAQDEGEE